jgi:hypothetical protein
MSPRAPVLFSAAELELGAGLPHRASEFLKREGLMPRPEREAVRGGRPLWNAEALARLSVIGAIFSASPSLSLAGRLGNAVIAEFVSLRGRLPSNLQHYREIYQFLTNEDRNEKGDIVELFLHKRLRDHPEIYLPSKARDDDFRIFIVDRRYVFSGSTRNIPFASPFGNGQMPLSLDFVIDGWGRGGGADSITIKGLEDVLPDGWMNEGHEQDIAKAIEARAIDAWRNSISIIGINASLAIRNAYDRIFDRRHGVAIGHDTS